MKIILEYHNFAILVQKMDLHTNIQYLTNITKTRQTFETEVNLQSYQSIVVYVLR